MKRTKKKKTSPIVYPIIFTVAFYIILRFASEGAIVGNMDIEVLSYASNDLFNFNRLIFTTETLPYAAIGALFLCLVFYNFQLSQHNSMKGATYGTAEWGNPRDVDKFKDKNEENNMIFTKTEQTSRNMGKSQHSRNVVLLGRPGTGKSRYFFKPNILNADGTIIVTDPKSELLRDCGYSLKQKGYDIKVLNLDQKFKSNRYNPLKYVKHVPKEALTLEQQEKWTKDTIAEDDVMSLIDVIFKNTKSDNIESTSGDPFWGATRSVLKRYCTNN